MSIEPQLLQGVNNPVNCIRLNRGAFVASAVVFVTAGVAPFDSNCQSD
jgi:hypothetical protein